METYSAIKGSNYYVQSNMDESQNHSKLSKPVTKDYIFASHIFDKKFVSKISI